MPLFWFVAGFATGVVLVWIRRKILAYRALVKIARGLRSSLTTPDRKWLSLKETRDGECS